MQQTKATPAERFLRLCDVLDRTALSRSTIYKKIQNGDFPPPIKCGARMSRWRESAVVQWMNDQDNTAKMEATA